MYVYAGRPKETRNAVNYISKSYLQQSKQFRIIWFQQPQLLRKMDVHIHVHVWVYMFMYMFMYVYMYIVRVRIRCTIERRAFGNWCSSYE